METQDFFDRGGEPMILNLMRLAMRNQNFRTAAWTGKDLQVTLMSVPPRSDIGLERHTGVEQMLVVVNGNGAVQFGQTREILSTPIRVGPGDAIMIPENTWHNITNSGRIPLKLISVYAPPQHPYGTVTPTKQDED